MEGRALPNILISASVFQHAEAEASAWRSAEVCLNVYESPLRATLAPPKSPLPLHSPIGVPVAAAPRNRPVARPFRSRVPPPCRRPGSWPIRSPPFRGPHAPRRPCSPPLERGQKSSIAGLSAPSFQSFYWLPVRQIHEAPANFPRADAASYLLSFGQMNLRGKAAGAEALPLAS